MNDFEYFTDNHNENYEYPKLSEEENNNLIFKNLFVNNEIIFFLGAGISVKAGIDDMHTLLHSLLNDDELDVKNKDILRDINGKIMDSNIEELLKVVEYLEQIDGVIGKYLKNEALNLSENTINEN